jgi:hypothetical protein
LTPWERTGSVAELIPSCLSEFLRRMPSVLPYRARQRTARVPLSRSRRSISNSRSSEGVRRVASECRSARMSHSGTGVWRGIGDARRPDPARVQVAAGL